MFRKIALPPQETPGSFDMKYVQCNESTCSFSGPTDVVIAGTTTYIGLEICGGQNLDLILQVRLIYSIQLTDSFLAGSLRLIESSMTQNISEPIIIFIISQFK